MVRAGQTPPEQFVAVVRPASFTTSKSKNLMQTHIVKMKEEMPMEVELQENNNTNSTKALYSHRSSPTSRGRYHGLYVFPLQSKIPNIFKKAGTYNFSFSIGSSITCQKKVLVVPSSKVGRWRLSSNMESIILPVGCSMKPYHIACFDEQGNRLRFTSVPSLEIKLKARPDFEAVIDKFEASLMPNGILKVKDMLVETGGLDKIRPHYKATLEIRSKDKPISVLAVFKPGPLKSAVEKNPQALENLLPDCTVKNFILEIFDGYNNHAPEGANVLIRLDGYRIQDSMGLNRKVNSGGCIDLSGILKVTAGYGKSVSLSVMFHNETLFRKESLVEKRELILLEELPGNCVAGSNLANLIFRVIDSNGSTDTNIHHDENSGSLHTMSIESDSRSSEDGISYAFVHGYCNVPSLSLPETVGEFSFKVFHSRCPELHMSLKIHLTPAQTFERDETRSIIPHPTMFLTPQTQISSATALVVAPTQQDPSSQIRVLPMTALSLAGSSQTGMMDMVEFTETIQEKLNSYNACVVEVNERVKCLEAEHEQANQELSALQASLGPLVGAFPECLSTKTSLMKKIEDKHHDTAAAVFCSLYRTDPNPQSFVMSRKGVFGLVALLGSVSSTSLSRVLSEYLGEDTMLALVCKSSRFVPNSPEHVRLQSEVDELGRSLTSRFHVLYLDAVRTWKYGLVKDDPQTRLAMVDPRLPNGKPVPGFLGFAVNMIFLAPQDLSIKSYSGHGLRESLFYSLLGNLQVYETQKHVEAALPHVNGCGAVSLDGFIVKENGYFIYSGSSKTEIHFPITVKAHEEEKLIKWEAAKEKVAMASKKLEKERCMLRKAEKRMKSANERYGNATEPFLENLLLDQE
ncbi:unnamed protein product [Microthlaspi erraticum]|uniref:Uncharacterized protein n=1 Tax=Microthlaspi erraticum TaxID=1685480 RepID=A0A6D2I4E7_9BRAS|nr:unnamed protein product [Microthlaspi erraticum]